MSWKVEDMPRFGRAPTYTWPEVTPGDLTRSQRRARIVKRRQPTESYELDGRTLEGRRERELVRQLVDCLGGGALTPIQDLLVRRAARLTLALEIAERKLIAEGKSDIAGSRLIHQWLQGLRLVLKDLGIKGFGPVKTEPSDEEAPPAPAASLRTYLASGRAA
jgi:hypothetical protein